MITVFKTVSFILFVLLTCLFSIASIGTSKEVSDIADKSDTVIFGCLAALFAVLTTLLILM